MKAVIIILDLIYLVDFIEKGNLWELNDYWWICKRLVKNRQKVRIRNHRKSKKRFKRLI